MSGKFSKYGLSRNQTFSFPDDGFLKIGKKNKKKKIYKKKIYIYKKKKKKIFIFFFFLNFFMIIYSVKCIKT